VCGRRHYSLQSPPRTATECRGYKQTSALSFRLARPAIIHQAAFMTAAELFNRATHGGGDDLAEVAALCREKGVRFCLIGGLAVNAYTRPVYTADADFVIAADQLESLVQSLSERNYRIECFTHSVNARKSGSDLLIQFTTDPFYQSFLEEVEEKEILGLPIPVAALRHLVEGKLLAWKDPSRRASKRAKDYADLLRLWEDHPHIQAWLPPDFSKAP
jgi:hypothetical protein